MASGPITSWQIDGETMETVRVFIFLGSKITADGNCSCEIKRHLLLGRKAMANLASILKSRDITLPTKVRIVKAMVFSSSHIQKLDHKEGWVLKNWYFWIVILKKTLESPLDRKEIKPVNLKGNQPWLFVGRTDAEAEAPLLWHTWCEELTHWKILMLGKIEAERSGWQRIRWSKRKSSHSVVSDSVTPWTVACQTPLSMGFPRQEYWSGLLFLSPGEFSNLGVKPVSPTLQANSLLSEPPGKAFLNELPK